MLTREFEMARQVCAADDTFMNEIPSSIAKIFIFADKLALYRLQSMLKSVSTEEESF